MTASPERLQLFRSIDDRLGRTGQHPRPAWWDGQAARGYLHPTARRSIFQVGRGGDKSTMGRRFALTEMLSPWRIPANERHYFVWVSENTDESSQRPRQIEADLLALGVPCTRTGNTVDIDGLPIGFKSFACRVGAVSGFRSIGFVADEEAKWRASDDGANPAREVIASIRAMTVTHPEAREWHFSSPLGLLDYHAEQFHQGDNAIQIVARAASWEANPGGITEQQTRELEPDARIWAREYLAIPQATASNAFDPDAVARAIGRSVTIAEYWQPIGVVDLSSGGGDACAYGVASYVMPRLDHIPEFLTRRVPMTVVTSRDGVRVTLQSETEFTTDFVRDEHGSPVPNPERGRARRPILVFHMVDAIEGRFAGQVSGSDLVRRIASEFRRHGVTDVIGDQREQFFAASEFARHNLRFHAIPWTNANKREAVIRLNRMFAEDAIALPDRDKLRRELLQYSERITASGAVTYSARGAGHDDEVSLLVTCILAELERLLPGSQLYLPNYRHVGDGR